MAKTCYLALLAYFLGVAPIHAASVVDATVLDELSLSPVWLKLLHYKNGRGEVETASFYLAPQGRHDARQELQATIKAMLEVPPSDDHAQCRFRARYYWLASQAFWASIGALVIPCLKYNEWSDESNIQSVSMILATGYLSNPASFFGHMLLRFNNKSAFSHTNLLDASVNYGAVVPPKENAVVYIIKGLFGGYTAKYADAAYYRFSYNYTDIDQRDVWEYRLQLSPAEVKLILAHSWELQQHEFSYFYLTKNCAFRIAELVELVLDAPIKPRETPWVMPVEIFREMSTYHHQGRPLIVGVQRILSRQNRFYEKLNQLSFHEQRTLKVIASNNQLQTARYRALTDEAKINIVDTLFDYYELKLQERRHSDDLEMKRQLLVEMLALSRQLPLVSWAAENKLPPHQSQKPSIVRLGYAYDSNEHGTGVFQFRPAYFDMLTPDVGKSPYAKVYMMNIEMDYVDGSTRLNQLDLVDIETLSLPNAGLPGGKNYAWKLSAGWDRPDLSCQSCLTGKLKGGVGHAVMIDEDWVVYGYLEGRYQTSRVGYERLAYGAQLGLVAKPSDVWHVQITLDDRYYIGGDRDPKRLIRIENRFGSTQDWDIRLRYERQQSTRVTASFGLYFN